MAQTLYAVIALAILASLSLGAFQNRADDREQRVHRVLGTEAQGVLREVLEAGENRPFDGADPLNAIPYTAASDFGPRSSAPAGSDLDDLVAGGAVVDLDDVHGLQEVIVKRWTEHPVAGVENPIQFRVTFSVDYVTPGGSGEWTVSAAPTPNKRVSVQATHPRADGPARLVRIYSDFR